MPDQVNVNMQQLFDKDVLADAEKSTIQSGEWMSVQEASNATGLSMGTLRRYIKSKRLKSRRLGRTINSKLEVWVTPDFLPDEAGQGDVVEFDGEVDSVTEQDQDDEFINFGRRDQGDQSSESTVAWLRQKLDEKDQLLREKDAKIDQLLRELAGASYRNGYLEAEKEQFESKLLLLEDKTGSEEKALETAAAPTVESKGTWAKVAGWLSGKS